ncbi:WhiB family transcriptional regulator [Streptomyces griseofuscus]|uniref:Transcriptional regulator WhiB n=1 Tax=Streptomyces griseofuscus TaxID=146922 RepID=A0A7H1Q3H2_9ACTN|nr:WhiB family transcriptional regulator [Streptomyces griseofuscus]QNT94852.1 transcription factor WhiB [Streptomyces griseofuscus]
MRTSYDAPTTHSRSEWWGDDALCRKGGEYQQPDQWFPEDWRRGPGKLDALIAKRVCARCPAITPCLEGALARREPVGIWGGLDPDERTQLSNDRGRAQAPAA